jgi:hypothetical protein
METDEIKLGRVGHYSYQQSCQTASIVYVHPDNTINVAGWTHEGDTFRREQVPVGPNESDSHEFHLNRACPWGR